jgi:hypothetical protein
MTTEVLSADLWEKLLEGVQSLSADLWLLFSKVSATFPPRFKVFVVKEFGEKYLTRGAAEKQCKKRI